LGEGEDCAKVKLVDEAVRMRMRSSEERKAQMEEGGF
jgi:hypothetical protein